MKLSLNSREQELKKTYLQLGNKYDLPKEIILMIYNIIINDKKRENELYRNFYLNNITYNIYEPIDTFGLSGGSNIFKVKIEIKTKEFFLLSYSTK